ncbi:MAG: hypothetical protein AABW51_02140 [Nanoarchaeota archaeon]
MNGQAKKFKRMLEGMVGGKVTLVIGKDGKTKVDDILTPEYNTPNGRDGLYVGNHQVALNRITGIEGNTVYMEERAK